MKTAIFFIFILSCSLVTAYGGGTYDPFDYKRFEECNFVNEYDPILLEGVRIRIHDGFRLGYFRWVWNIIEMQSCERDVFEHELTHYVMKRVGWTLRRSQQHDFTFDATLLYVKENIILI